MVGAVEGGEALEIWRRPRVFALQELVDFALRGGTRGEGGGVGFFGFFEGFAGLLNESLWWVGRVSVAGLG